MKIVRTFLIFCAIAVTASNAGAFQISPQTSNKNCTDTEYRRQHPEKCPSFLYTAAPILSGATVLGGAIALIGLSGAAGGSDSATEYYQPTLAAPDYVGGDVSSLQLAAVTSAPEYEKNLTQYNDIRLAYSIARGYTGRGTIIAVLDAGLDSWHGAAVAAVAGGAIAPNAIVNSYKIANNLDFVSYREIGDAIGHATDANVYNASWSVPMRANDLRSRNQLSNLTDANFVNQLSAAAARDAIFVWAAGNDSDKQSSALSAIPVVMPEMRGHFINVVAWDSATGTLAEYSNACGITANWCITAPGSNIDTGASIANGTSFATPIVSAAVAVIREAFPYMTAPQITNLLFETARDLGTPGVDAVYGHGMLDLERATRPVGAPLVPIDGGAMQPLQTARVSGAIAHNIMDANPKFAYFDKYGRAFDAKLSDVIEIKNPGLGFQRLRATEDIKIAEIGNFEMGLANSDIAIGDGFLQIRDNNLFGFVGTQNDFEIGQLKLTQRARLAFGAPRASQNSMISNLSNIYTASIDVSANIGDWSFGISVPDTIIGGTMNLHLPTGRADNGAIIYNDYAVDMRTRPSIEYSVSYRAFTASFVDNPYGTDEFFIMTRGRIKF